MTRATSSDAWPPAADGGSAGRLHRLAAANGRQPDEQDTGRGADEERRQQPAGGEHGRQRGDLQRGLRRGCTARGLGPQLQTVGRRRFRARHDRRRASGLDDHAGLVRTLRHAHGAAAGIAADPQLDGERTPGRRGDVDTGQACHRDRRDPIGERPAWRGGRRRTRPSASSTSRGPRCLRRAPRPPWPRSGECGPGPSRRDYIVWRASLIARSTGASPCSRSRPSAFAGSSGGCARNRGREPRCGCAACTRNGWHR